MRIKSLFALALLSLYALAATPTYGEDIKMSGTAWKNHYFGRLMLALPLNAEIAADYKLFDAKLELISKNARTQVPSLVSQKIDEIKRGVARDTNGDYEKTIELDNGSTLVLSRMSSLYTFHIYFITSKNTAYYMAVPNITEKGMLGAVERMRMLSDAIHYRHPDEAPPSGGFALEAGYTTLQKNKFFESIYMGAQIKDHPGTYISLLTNTITEKESTLIERFDAKQYDTSIGELVSSGSIKTLRKRKRSIGNIEGEEVALSTRAEGKTYYAFQFEYEGTIDSTTQPYIALELGTHEVGSDFKSDDEALAFWDKMLTGLTLLQ
ncbi:T6SS immunity protein Tli4 family protein [Pseudomonas putida]|uniref:T6SS immunity protein Tli4 family protein n=1 Tax=Pseudomonas putida TaxID=303 RepID=UPI002363CD4F|nr:T6SS immunity protein Tli4 family protein [Pseudomonas putida]MDD2154593.1 T6SS immunity protein Tli4 family protein [Pseudomonas putida]